MRRIASILVLAVLTLALAGCPKDAYTASVKASSDVSQAVSSAINITASYYSAGTFNDAQKATAASIFTIVTDCNMSFRKTVVSVHNAGQTGAQAFLPIASSFVACTQKMPQVQNDPKLNEVVQAINTAIQGVNLAIANSKGAK